MSYNFFNMASKSDYATTDSNIFTQYADSINFSLVILTLIYNVFEICRIKYGHILITKITLRPYYLSLGYLFIDVLFYINNDSIVNQDGMNLLMIIEITLENCRLVLFLTFIIYRILDNKLLHAFMVFQEKHRLEELEINRHLYNAKEKKYSRITEMIVKSILILQILLLIIFYV